MMNYTITPRRFFLLVLLLSENTTTIILALALSSLSSSSLSSSNKHCSSSSSRKRKRVVIVGGGVGGLAIAARIAASSSSCSSVIQNKNDNGGGGVHITILEKNAGIGGRCGSFFVSHPDDRDDDNDKDKESVGVGVGVVSGGGNSSSLFRHERGPSLLLLPHIYQELFADCNSRQKTKKRAEDYGLQMVPCIPAYQAVFDDGDCIHVGFPKQQQQPEQAAQQQQPKGQSVSSPLEVASRQKMNLLEPNGAAKWDDYLQTCRAFVDCGLPNFIQQRLHLSSFPAFLYESLRNSARAWPLKPHSDVIQAFFPTCSKLRALASFQDLYVGLEPYRRYHHRNSNDNDNDEKDKSSNRRDDENDDKDAPWWLGLGGGVMDTTAAAVFGLLAAIELHPDTTNDESNNNNNNSKIQCGVYAPIGGFQAVTDAMERLCLDVGHVEIKCQHTVTQVTNRGVYYIDGSACSGDEKIQLFERADLVIVNADLPYAQATLLSTSSSTALSSSSSSSSLNEVDDKNEVKGKSQQSTIRGQSQQQQKEKAMAEESAIRYDWNDRDYRFSSGVIAFHWSMNATLDFLNTHNVYLSASTTERAHQSWQVLRNDNKKTRRRKGKEQQQDDPINANENDNFWRTTISSRHDEDNNKTTAAAAEEKEETFPPFNFYVHRPSKTDPTAAPKGCDSLLVLVPCPTLLRNPTYANLPKNEAIEKYQKTQFTEPLIDRVRRAVLHRMAATNQDGRRCTSVYELRHCILHEVVDTPATYADSWNVGAGTPFGLSHGFGQLSLTRPSSKGTSILSPFQRQSHQQQVVDDMPNVLYVGASSRPGNGVPLVLIGAKLVAEQAIAQLLKKQEES